MEGKYLRNGLSFCNESQETVRWLLLLALLLLTSGVAGQNGAGSLPINNTGSVTTNITNAAIGGGQSPTPSKSPVTTSAALLAKNCVLTPNDTELPTEISSLLSTGAKIIKYYLELEDGDTIFANTSEYYMYKPLFWVRATGRQGRNILLLRPEYDMLSLGTLGLNVHTINVSLHEEPRHCLSQLTYTEIEELIRRLVMNDFESRGPDESIKLPPTDSVCNMRILDDDGVAEFRYICCNKTDMSHNKVECRVLQNEMWLDLLFGVVTLIKIIVILFSPNWIPESIYRLKENFVQFVYITEPEETMQLRTAVTSTPEKYPEADVVCRLSKFTHMEKFKLTIQKMVPDRVYDFQFEQVQLLLKQKRLLGCGSAPVGFFKSLYNTIVECKIRDKPSLQACCDAGICMKCCCEDQCSWYRLLREIMNAIVLSLIVLPWVLRVLIYYDHEHDELYMRKAAASERGLCFYFPGSLTLYLTPLHALFLMVYVVLSFEAFVFGVLRKRTKEKLKFVLRKCYNDMLEFNRQQVIGWVVQMLLVPCASCGLLGILIAPIVWIFTLPIGILVLTFYLFPTVNLTGRLFAHFFVYSMPRETYTRCKFSDFTSRLIESIEKTLEARVDMKELAKNESVVKNEAALRTKRGRCQQLIVIIFCLISLYSCVFLLTEFVSFFVEIVVYTMIGVILNASITLTYISLGLYVVFYANDVVGNVANKFTSFSSTMNAYILGLGKSQAEPIFFKNTDDQLNRAFRVETGRPCAPKRPVALTKNDENEPRWKFSKLVLFLTNTDETKIPKRFYFEACNMPYSMVPGQLFSSYIAAIHELSFIFLFLIFVLIVVLAFGETYELSASNRLLATIASGFLPLILRRVLFKSHSVPSIDTSSDINFQVCINDVLNEYEQTWPIFDIDVTKGAPSIEDKTFLTSEVSENPIEDQPDTADTNKDNGETTEGGLKAEGEFDDIGSKDPDGNAEEENRKKIDLLIDIRDVDEDEFPNMFSAVLAKVRGIGSMTFLDDTDEAVELSPV